MRHRSQTSSISPRIKLRVAAPGDADFFLRVRNEPSVRQASFNSDTIQQGTHRRWYRRNLRDAASRMFVVESQSSQPLGVIRFTRKDIRTAEVHMALLRQARQRGIGTLAFREALRRLNRENPWGHTRVLAKIRNDNTGSVRFFSRLGFRPVKSRGQNDSSIQLIRRAYSKNILIFVDAGPDIGMGHLMREMSLYPFLKEKGLTGTFFIRRQGRAFPVARTSKVLSAVRAQYVYECEDWEVFLAKHDFGAILFDTLRPVPERLIERAKELSIPCILIGQYATVPSWADACFNPYGISKSLSSGAQLIRDPRYVILSGPFARFRTQGRSFSVQMVGRRLFVLPGAGNTRGMVFKLVSALRHLPDHYEVNLITGPFFTRNRALKKAIRRIPCQVRHESCLPQIRILHRMRRSDVGLLSFGRTVDEARAVGLPCLLLSSSSLNKQGAADAQRQGGAIALGDFRSLSALSIANQIIALMEDPRRRKTLSLRGRTLIDGRGSERVASLIERWVRGGVSQERAS